MNNEQDFATYYLERTTSASKEQGIDDLVIALEKQGIKATSEQTGGFTMCAFIKLKGGKYIYANTYGAGLYDEEGYGEDIYNNESEEDQQARAEDVAKGVANWLKGYKAGQTK
jgi:hypothetical protein